MMNPTLRSCLALAGFALLAVPSFAQTTIQVSGGGAALENAAMTAAPGSIFILQPGRYDNFTWTVPNATIVAPQRASIAGVFGMGPAAIQLTLKNIDFVTGRRFGGYYYYPDPGWISSNGTNLVIDDCTAKGLYCTGCTVSASNCRIGGDDTSVQLTDVDAVFTDVTVLPGYFYSSYGFSAARPGMRVIDSRVRIERSSISGQVVYAGSYPTASQGLIVSGTSVVTVADSTLVGVPPSPPYYYPQFGPAPALSVDATSTVTVSDTMFIGPTSGNFTTAPLATAEWVTPGLSPGNTVTARFTEQPSIGTAVLLSFDFVPFTTSLVAEQLYVLGTPNWVPLTGGLSNAQGEFTVSLTIPPTVALQFQTVWLTGLFGGNLPVRSTAPLGGVIF